MSQGASRAAPGKSGLHARGEGERVLALESREGTRASRRLEEGLSRSLSGGGAFNLSQHQGLFQGVSSSHQVAKGLEFQLQHQSVQ